MSTFDAKLKRLLASKSPDELRASVVADIGDSMEWYEANARRMGRYSRLLRFVAIVLAAAGLATPVATLSVLSVGATDTTEAAAWGNFGYVAAALAAGLLALDSHFGYSAAWMRYRLALLELERILIEFVDEWSNLPAPAEGAAAVTPECLAVVKKARGALLTALNKETSEWVEQMRLNIGGLVNGLRSRQGGNDVLEMFSSRGDESGRTAQNEVDEDAVREEAGEEESPVPANDVRGLTPPASRTRAAVNGSGAGEVGHGVG